MTESARIRSVLDQLRSMSAADMKLIAKFGKVTGYAQGYLDIKDSLRSLATMARNVYGVDLIDELNAIEPIVFTGMIPNETFNTERRRLIQFGERLVERLEQGVRPSAAIAPAAGGVPAPVLARPRIWVSETCETLATSDLRRCLSTADCDVHVSDALARPDYSPAAAMEAAATSQGAVICLMAPEGAEGDAGERSRLTKNALVELGIALGRFPERTFLVVQDRMIGEVPASMHGLISFRTSGGQLSFEEGQRMVQIFKKAQWADA
jgi:hypothetical protein